MRRGMGLEGEDHGSVGWSGFVDDGKAFDRERPAFAQPYGACGCACGMGTRADAGRPLVAFRRRSRMIHREIY